MQVNKGLIVLKGWRECSSTIDLLCSPPSWRCVIIEKSHSHIFHYVRSHIVSWYPWNAEAECSLSSSVSPLSADRPSIQSICKFRFFSHHRHCLFCTHHTIVSIHDLTLEPRGWSVWNIHNFFERNLSRFNIWPLPPHPSMFWFVSGKNCSSAPIVQCGDCENGPSTT